MLEPYIKYTRWVWFVGGVAAGAIAFSVIGSLSGYSFIHRDVLEQQRRQLAELRDENDELTEELFRPRVPTADLFDPNDLPYDEAFDAKLAVETARADAVQERKFLMIIFGANWCLDCLTLHRNLESDEVTEYTRDLFRFVNVNVGKFNQNRDLATDLGVDLRRGIPVAIVFDPQGQLIGTTNDGQLEPARRYSSKQILRFVRDIAERSRITAPDDVR